MAFDGLPASGLEAALAAIAQHNQAVSNAVRGSGTRFRRRSLPALPAGWHVSTLTPLRVSENDAEPTDADIRVAGGLQMGRGQ